MNSSNNEMNSTTSSVKSFKCNCCDYTTNRNQNLLRHKQTHLKKGGDDISVLSDDEDHTASVSVVVSNTNKECRMCINYKQLIEMKDSRIYELEKQIELLQKDMRIAVLETKLESKDVVLDMSGNFVGLQQQTIENVIQMQQPQPKGRPTATKKSEETKETVLQFPAPAPKPAPKPAETEEQQRVRLRDEGLNMFDDQTPKKKTMKKGGMTSCYAKGGGIEVRGKTKGRFV